MSKVSTRAVFSLWGRYEPQPTLRRLAQQACNHGLAETSLSVEEVDEFLSENFQREQTAAE